MEFHLTPELLDTIDQYIKGELEGDALLAFEKKLKENESLREELTIQQRMFKALEGKNVSSDFIIVEDIHQKINNPEYQTLSKKIKDIGSEYTQNPGSGQKTLWIRFKRMMPATAAVLLVLVISTVYLVNSNQSIDHYYYDNVSWETELISFAEKGNTKSDFAKAEAFFNTKDYTEAITILKAINENDELYPFSLIYLGASYANLDQDQKALDAFSKLSSKNEYAESSKGLWYTALIYLKQKDKERAIRMLKNITEDTSNYHYEDALKILKELQ